MTKTLTTLGLAISGFFAIAAVPAGAVLPTPESGVVPALNASTAQASQTAVNTAEQAVTSKTVAFVVGQSAQGQTLTPAAANTALKAGDVLEYQTMITNNSPNRVRSMTVTIGVPSSVQLNTITSLAPDAASVDGQRYSSYPLKGRVDGVLQSIPLPYYQGLRWTLQDMEQGATRVLSYRAQVQ